MNDASPPILDHNDGVATAHVMLKAQHDHITTQLGTPIVHFGAGYAPALLATLMTQYVAVVSRGSLRSRSEVLADLLGRLLTILSGVQLDNVAREADAEAVAKKMFDDFFPGARA